jgi:hypothetical protein
VLLSLFYNGGCVIQGTKVNFSDEELTDMIEHCGLNTLIQMGSHLSERLRRSQQDPKLLSLLQGLDEIGYGGLPIPGELEQWAHKNGIIPTVRSIIASIIFSLPMLSLPGYIFKY